MFYLALCFIIFGIILLGFALFSSNGKDVLSKSTTSNDHFFNRTSQHVNNEHKTVSSSTNRSLSGGTKSNKSKSKVSSHQSSPGLIVDDAEMDTFFHQSEDVNRTHEQNERHRQGKGEHWSAILLKDSSGLIDYHNNQGTIDPTLKGYKNINRVGEGTLYIENDGLSFFRERKLYRLDYRRMKRVLAGSNYCACEMLGTKGYIVFLFLGKHPGQKILDSINSYQS